MNSDLSAGVSRPKGRCDEVRLWMQSKGEAAWASKRLEAAQAIIGEAWMRRLEEEAKKARAAKAEWERDGRAELDFKKARQLQIEIAEI